LPEPALHEPALLEPALLEVEDLRKLYPVGKAPGQWRRPWRKSPPRPLLHAVGGVSLAIGRGETVGLVGESGCGKSTLVRLLARLIDPTGGTIRFDGEEIGAVPAARFARMPRRAQIQMVFQDATDSLNPRFTAFRAIADPLLRLRRLSRAALRERVEEVARLCGLPGELLTRFPHQLSGGQKARVGIARAIAVEPRLLILDEPTSALDVSVQVVILQLLEELKRKLDLSYLFVSHDLNVVRLLCDRILVMYLGHIVESGPAEQVFAAPAHPYTQALLSALPKPGARAGERVRAAASGEPRSPIDPDPAVCPLYGRCTYSTDRCRTAMPELRAVGPGRLAACHFPAIDGPAAQGSPSVAALA
jgi:oligopeptide/dipeptide ABC transporter ATP-binding protein